MRNAETKRAYMREWRTRNRDRVLLSERRWQDEHRDHVRARARKWKAANRESFLARYRRWYQVNRDELRAKQRAYRQANPDKVRQWRRNYRAAHAEELRAKAKANAPRYRESHRIALARYRASANGAAKRRAYNLRTAARKLQQGYAWRARNRERFLELARCYEANRRSNRRGAHTPEQWMSRLAFFGFRCWLCGWKLTLRTATKDHVIPIALGGWNFASNLRPACRSCNCSKGARPAEEVQIVRGR